MATKNLPQSQMSPYANNYQRSQVATPTYSLGTSNVGLNSLKCNHRPSHLTNHKIQDELDSLGIGGGRHTPNRRPVAVDELV